MYNANSGVNWMYSQGLKLTTVKHKCYALISMQYILKYLHCPSKEKQCSTYSLLTTMIKKGLSNVGQIKKLSTFDFLSFIFCSEAIIKWSLMLGIGWTTPHFCHLYKKLVWHIILGYILHFSHAKNCTPSQIPTIKDHLMYTNRLLPDTVDWFLIPPDMYPVLISLK